MNQNNLQVSEISDNDFSLLQKLETGLTIADVQDSDVFLTHHLSLIGITPGILSPYLSGERKMFSLSRTEKILKLQILYKWGKDVFNADE